MPSRTFAGACLLVAGTTLAAGCGGAAGTTAPAATQPAEAAGGAEAPPEAEAPATRPTVEDDAPTAPATIPTATPASEGDAAGADEPPARLRLCTGRPGNNYHAAGSAIAERLKGAVEVEVIESRGSWDNLEGIDSQPRRCDAVIAQDDAYTLYQFERPKSELTIDRVVPLYPEYIHLICNREAGVDDVFDLRPDRHRILVNEFGSGSYITWRLFGHLNPFYGRIPSSEVGTETALLKIYDGVEAHCFWFVSGLDSGTLRTANDKFGDRLRLVRVADERVYRDVGKDRRPVYAAASIPTGTYAKLQDGEVPTPAVDAVFFISPEWKARYPGAAEKLARALVDLVPELRRAHRPGD